MANSRLTTQINALFEKMKIIPNGKEKSKTANLILELDDQRVANWKQIDE